METQLVVTWMPKSVEPKKAERGANASRFHSTHSLIGENLTPFSPFLFHL